VTNHVPIVGRPRLGDGQIRDERDLVVRHLRVLVVVLAAVAGVLTGASGSTAVAAPAEQSGYDKCKAGWFCIYSSWDGGGTR
jgi:hypothetical protein